MHIFLKFFIILFYYFILFYLFNYLFNYLFIYFFFFSKSRYGMIAERVQRNVYISKDDKFSFQKRNK